MRFTQRANSASAEYLVELKVNPHLRTFLALAFDMMRQVSDSALPDSGIPDAPQFKVSTCIL